MATSPTTYGMSPECKSFVVKKVYEHYMMNICWKGICQKLAAILVFVFPVISLLSKCDGTLQYTITILSGIISFAIFFFCDTKEYYESLHIVVAAYITDCENNDFEEKFKDLMPYIREIDFARGRSDYKSYCDELNIVQNPCDKLTNHDIAEMNRQRYMIAAICSIFALVCLSVLLLIPYLDMASKTILIFILASTTIGFIFMLIDCKWIIKRKRK